MQIDRKALQEILDQIPEGGGVDLRLAATDVDAPGEWAERAALRVQIRKLEERAMVLRGFVNLAAIDLYKLIHDFPETEGTEAAKHAWRLREVLEGVLADDKKDWPNAE